MSTVSDFVTQFDDKGVFRAGDGEVDVVFLTPTGKPYPGKLHFMGGLCVRVEMQGASPWAYPDDSPLTIQFTLDLGEQRPHVIQVDQGRIVRHFQAPPRPSRGEFLANLRRARNLFVHGRPETNGLASAAAPTNGSLARRAIWLTPKSFKGFNDADFPELGSDRQEELRTAVQDFLSVAKQVPPGESPTQEQYDEAVVAFQKVVEILRPYLPVPDESQQLETALRGVTFPPWLVNWDYELGRDDEDEPLVWVDVFVEERAPRYELGRFAIQIIPTIRHALVAEGIVRWPYLRVHTIAEHMTA